MSRSRREKVAFQGESGAFSQVAVHQILGDRAEPVPCQWFDEVFTSLRDKKVDAALVPIENTLHGSVHENYDHLVHFNFEIVAETKVRIIHNLIALPGTRFSAIRRVYSHPVALNQCLKFFAEHPQIEKVTFYDTAGSVKMLVEQKLKDAGAIASATAAEIYGAHIIRRSIEDDRQNFTRFFLLRRRGGPRRREKPESPRGWKTSIVFTTRNVPGALFRCLSAFALRDISLAKIESRPLRGKPWEYLFYLDFLANVEEERSQKALGHLQELADFLLVLGSYPRAD